MLHIHQITKQFGNHTALKKVSMQVPKQSIFGLLGPNGAGKTTLIRIITQIIFADSGEVLFNNEKINASHISRIGYLPEERGLYKKMKVGEQLLYLAQLRNLRKKEAVEQLKTWFKKFEIQDWWGKKVEDLSKGMQQKVQFIATVINQPELIILDEPFSGFDPINVNLIKDEILTLRKNGSTIIFSTHRMETVEELCDYIVLINKSEKIIEGPKHQIKQKYKSNVFRVEHNQSIHTNGFPFEVIGKVEKEPNLYLSTLKLNSAYTANQLLEILIKQVPIHSFSEIIPDMNEIFIKTVTGGKENE